MSYQVKVKVYGESSYNGNGLRFSTPQEAESYAKDLYSRWTLMETYRVEESSDPVNYAWVDGCLEEVKTESNDSEETGPRSIATIAREVKRLWNPVNFGAKPYLDAMLSLDSVEDMYGCDSADSIMRYFLSNASTWRGDDAKRTKAELKKLVGMK